MAASTSITRSSPSLRYDRSKCAVFCKTTAAFGGFSNMAAGFPLSVAGEAIKTSEALYQACRFPHLPDLQRTIIADKSPMGAKFTAKENKLKSRTDWDDVEVDVMQWCLQVKLKQNWEKFASLLASTGGVDIVEETAKHDRFWGAKGSKNDPKTLEGINALGRLLMQLRDEVNYGSRTAMTMVGPLSIPNFLLYGKPIPPL